jgi:hypothetical protein
VWIRWSFGETYNSPDNQIAINEDKAEMKVCHKRSARHSFDQEPRLPWLQQNHPTVLLSGLRAIWSGRAVVESFALMPGDNSGRRKALRHSSSSVAS